MKHLHYVVHDGDPENKEPVGHCIMSEDGSLISAATYDELVAQIKFRDTDPEILENCGWTLKGEEQKLLDPAYADILKFGLALREQRLQKAQEEKK